MKKQSSPKLISEILPKPEIPPEPVKSSRSHRLRAVWLVAGLVCLIIGGALLFLWHRTQVQQRASYARNAAVIDALHSHPVQTLVGQSQRVTALRPALGTHIPVIGLVHCPTAGAQPNYGKHSFAYILSYDSVTTASACSLDQIIRAYGRPNESVLISGTFTHPHELLLLYDQGLHKSSPSTPQLPRGPATVVPALLSQLPANSDCFGKTVVNIVAHQDDDLLFLSPSLLHDIQAEKCVRTIYLTAGDAGRSKYYWLSREQGSENAYSYMTPADDNLWIQRIVQIADSEFVNIASPRSNPNISLVFMHLPDGSPDGTGFKSSRYESLVKLASGKIDVIHSVDGQSTYTSYQLTTALANLLDYYQPSVVNTQSTQRVLTNNPFPDHSDHVTTGLFARQAYHLAYGVSLSSPLIRFNGYPIRNMPASVSPTDLQEKELAFLQYARYDPGVCQSVEKCNAAPDYGAYLQREYRAYR